MYSQILQTALLESLASTSLELREAFLCGDMESIFRIVEENGGWDRFVTKGECLKDSKPHPFSIMAQSDGENVRCLHFGADGNLIACVYPDFFKEVSSLMSANLRKPNEQVH